MSCLVQFTDIYAVHGGVIYRNYSPRVNMTIVIASLYKFNPIIVHTGGTYSRTKNKQNSHMSHTHNGLLTCGYLEQLTLSTLHERAQCTLARYVIESVYVYKHTGVHVTCHFYYGQGVFRAPK